MNKNVWLLFASNACAFSVAPVTVFLSGIIGSSISPIKSLSTLPMSLSIVGTALFIIVASKIMSITGRKKGFILSSITSSLFALLAAYAVMKQNFILYSFSCFSLGFGMAFAHQYRFAAAESVSKDKVPRAISIILLGGIVSAFIGPSVANFSKDLFSNHMYVGSYLSLAALTFLPTIFFLFYKNTSKIELSFKYSGRSYFELVSQPRFLQAVISSAFGYAIMTFLMTGTPLSMHVIEGISLNKTSIVIQIHVACMFLPSLIAGNLVKKIGHSKMMYVGVGLYCITVVISLFDQSFLNYMLALVFLGFGWNFLFISGTSLLVLTYKEEEKYRAQGFNDFVVYSVHALGSLSAGILIVLTNWKIMNLICIPLIIVIILITLRADLLTKK